MSRVLYLCLCALKYVMLLLLGFFPLYWFGHYMTYLMWNVYTREAGPYFLFGLAVIAAWFIFGMISKLLIKSRWRTILALNIPAFLVLILTQLIRFEFFRQLISNSDWAMTINIEAQTFYLPLMRFGVVVLDTIPFLPFIDAMLSPVIAFAFMVGFSYLGHFAAERLLRKAAGL